MTPLAVDARQWWRASGALERYLTDLVAAELRLLRPGGPWPPHIDPHQVSTTTLGPDGLGLDSLECIAVAAALSEALHLHRGGLADTLLTAPLLGAWVDAAAAALDRFSDLITVRSSGSTGRSRSHVHKTDALAMEVGLWAEMLPGRRRIRTAVACHHIYGFLFTLMLPAAMALPVEDARSFSPGAVAATMRPGDVIIGHPVFWDSLLRAAPSGWPPDVIGVTSGAPCAAAIFSGLRAAGLLRLIDVYGSSETAGVGWRDEPAAYRLLPLWERRQDGVQAASGGPAAALPDRLDWDGGQRFRIGDRHDGAVMVGGINVDLGRVRTVLREHPDVADAVVRLMRPSEGARLKAFLKPLEDSSVNVEALRLSVLDFAEARLSVPERPRAYRFGRDLPQSETGKPTDWDV
jgi:long-chain acyl-CoA synthetase